ncbi:MAG: PRC-barrel domain-containing protein [Clostridiales bacterium]
MLSGRQLHGLVVKSANGTEIGRVADLVVDQCNGRLFGFMIHDTGLIQKIRYLPLESIKDISLQGVIVCRKKMFHSLPVNLVRLSAVGWRGSLLMDQSGQDKGSISDVLLEGKELAGFEISDGVVGDFFKRRNFLPFAQSEIVNGVIQEK